MRGVLFSRRVGYLFIAIPVKKLVNTYMMYTCPHKNKQNKRYYLDDLGGSRMNVLNIARVIHRHR